MEGGCAEETHAVSSNDCYAAAYITAPRYNRPAEPALRAPHPMFPLIFEGSERNIAKLD